MSALGWSLQYNYQIVCRYTARISTQRYNTLYITNDTYFLCYDPFLPDPTDIKNTYFQIRCASLKNIFYLFASKASASIFDVVKFKKTILSSCIGFHPVSYTYFVFTTSGRNEDGSSVTGNLHWLVSSSQLRTSSR